MARCNYEYQVFNDLGKATYEMVKGTNLPSGYQKIWVNVVFDVKHDEDKKQNLLTIHTSPETLLRQFTKEWVLLETSGSPYSWLNSPILNSGELTLQMYI